MPFNDPIVDEIHKFRAEHAAAFDYDVRAIVRDLIRQQEEAKARGKHFVKSPGKRCKPGLRYTPIIEGMPADQHAPADT
jgi:hypothetical protein